MLYQVWHKETTEKIGDGEALVWLYTTKGFVRKVTVVKTNLVSRTEQSYIDKGHRALVPVTLAKQWFALTVQRWRGDYRYERENRNSKKKEKTKKT